jgi:hypothetical protein
MDASSWRSGSKPAHANAVSTATVQRGKQWSALASPKFWSVPTGPAWCRLCGYGGHTAWACKLAGVVAHPA